MTALNKIQQISCKLMCVFSCFGVCLVPLSSLKTAMAGFVSAALHSLTVPSPEQDSSLWWAELYTKPQTASVCPDSAPRSTDGSMMDRDTHFIIFLFFVYSHTHTHTGVCRQTGTYRMNRTGRCWGLACSSTEWSRPNRRWNTDHRWSSSPHTEPDPWDQTRAEQHQTQTALGWLLGLGIVWIVLIPILLIDS